MTKALSILTAIVVIVAAVSPAFYAYAALA